jgi:hypothetical protein
MTTPFESPENAQGMYHLDEEKAAEIGRLTDPRLTGAQVIAYACGEWKEGQEHQDWLNSASAQGIAEWISDGLRGMDDQEIENAVGPG